MQATFNSILKHNCIDAAQKRFLILLWFGALDLSS